MNKGEFEKFTGTESLSVAEAMRRIDRNTCGILILTDSRNHLTGTLTDGDIRRFLLAGGTLNDPAGNAANHDPKAATSMEEAQLIYHKKNYVAVPVVSEDGLLTDIYIGAERQEKEKAVLGIPVVINAGGKGTRLDPYTRVIPKPLIPVGELPIIEHIMKEFQGYGCNDFSIIVNYKREIMKAFFAENEKSYSIQWHDETKPLGTGGGLSLLKGKISSTFFFTNCDSLLTADYGKILKFHRDNQNVITMVCVYKNFSIPYGVIEMGKNGSIEKMTEKPALSFLTNTGIYIVEPEVLNDIEDDRAIGFPDIIQQQMDKGRKTAVYPVSENDWMDMGQLSELEKMRKRLYGE